MASSGPTSATDRNGERCQSTTSIRAAEAINENGTIVQRTFERASAKSERCELTATTAVIRIRFTPYWAEAAAPTRASTPLAPSPCSGDEAAPAAVAASASTETLYATRIGGRCSSSWVTAGARKTTSTRTAVVATSRGFQCSNGKPPPRLLCRTPPIVDVVGPGGIPRKGEPQALPGALEAGFGKRTPTPGELLAVPADERSHCDALSRGVDHPDAAEVDPGMPDRRRPGAGAGGAEEEHVAGLQLGEADPPRARHFTAHLVRRPAFDGRRQRFDAERRLWLLARAAPDVGEADESDGRVEDALLPAPHQRELEGRRCVFGVLGLPAGE